MDLENLLPHKRNTRVLVNGTVYEIDKDGVCRDVAAEHAEKLLQNVDTWQKYDPKAAAQRATARVERAKAAGGVKLLGADGKPVQRPEDATKPVMNAEKKAKEADNTAAMEQAVEAAEKSKTKGDPPVPEGDAEWPDPEESMSMEYLKLMADAYEVSYASNIGKKTLIARIKDAMYE